MKGNIAIALSGGIDSLVAGYLLKKEHKNLFGIHFKYVYRSMGGSRTKIMAPRGGWGR